MEDNCEDIIGKAQRGLGLREDQLAQRAGIARTELADVLGGSANEPILRKLAPVLALGGERLVVSARKAWAPQDHQVASLTSFTTPYHGMTVNAYLIWDPDSSQAAAFDTGADCGGILASLQERDLALKLIFLTHTHADHIADLHRLQARTGATILVSQQEPLAQAATFAPGESFTLGKLRIQTRLTSGHSPGGTTYVVSGLAAPAAVVGDALFAGSMGGGLVSYAEALASNRSQILTLSEETILCPGHGPMTSVGEEKRHNPFFPEFDQEQDQQP